VGMLIGAMRGRDCVELGLRVGFGLGESKIGLREEGRDVCLKFEGFGGG
jgi:hypothetical protein